MNLSDRAERRAYDTGRLVGCIQADGPQTMESLCRLMPSGTSYVRVLIEKCDELVVVSRPKVVLDWVIDIERIQVRGN